MNGSQVTLICLPFAGGSAYSYGDLEKSVGPFIDLLPMELPGRGRRFAEPLLTDVHDMVDDLFGRVKDAVLLGPYAVFGHSLGAKLAFELARRIVRERLPEPAHLFVSGSAAPSVPPKDRCLHLLPCTPFRRMIAELGGTPPEVLREEGLMDLFEPVLRADFQACNTYAYREGRPLTLPITVLMGLQDTVERRDAIKWGEETRAETQRFAFRGGHFFLFDHWGAIGQIIARSLDYLSVYSACVGNG